MDRYAPLFVAIFALGCAARSRPPDVFNPAPEVHHHHAWWLGLQASRTTFTLGPNLVGRCPEVTSEQAAGSEEWWREVIAGLAACDRRGALERLDVVMWAHVADSRVPRLRRYVRDLSSALEQALETASVDVIVRSEFAIVPAHALPRRVAVEVELEHAH